MKKLKIYGLLALAVVLALSLAFVACGGGDDDDDQPGTTGDDIIMNSSYDNRPVQMVISSTAKAPLIPGVGSYFKVFYTDTDEVITKGRITSSDGYYLTFTPDEGYGDPFPGTYSGGAVSANVPLEDDEVISMTSGTPQVLAKIEATYSGSKDYICGDAFNTAAVNITGTYTNNETFTITGGNPSNSTEPGSTISYSCGATLEHTETSVTVSLTLRGVTKTATISGFTFTTVIPHSITASDSITYHVTNSFTAATNATVTATNCDASVPVSTDLTFNPSTIASLADTDDGRSISVTYAPSIGGKVRTVTTTYTITVEDP